MAVLGIIAIKVVYLLKNLIGRAIYSQIIEAFHKKKAIIITGPRQVGKTTLLEAIKDSTNSKVLYLNCDEPDVRLSLENATSGALQALIGNNTLVLIDEAQRVKNIGLTLKLLVDTFKTIQVIATGSSALELADEINEPLTGRKREFQLYPFATAELAADTSVLQEGRLLEQRMIYGFYPEIVNSPSDAQTNLLELANNYLYKDILALQDIRKPALLERLLIALALQIGNEVSYTELGQTIGKKGKKIYFYDNGIRNAIIKNFSPLSLRQDTGALWENFLVAEREKFNHYTNHHVNTYLWRTHQQQEIERAKAKIPAIFKEAYPGTITGIVTRENYFNFVNFEI